MMQPFWNQNKAWPGSEIKKCLNFKLDSSTSVEPLLHSATHTLRNSKMVKRPCRGGGGHLYFRLDIFLIKGHSKHTLNTYFSGMKIDPKYVFLHEFS